MTVFISKLVFIAVRLDIFIVRSVGRSICVTACGYLSADYLDEHAN